MDFPNIRLMELPDLEQVTELARQLGYPNEVDDVVRRFQNLQGHSDHSLYVYAEEKTVSGYIHLEKIPGLLTETKCEIKALVVSEVYRGKGLGKSLVDFAKTWAKMNQLNTIVVRTSILRERAHRFYEREGFAMKKTSHFFAMKL